MGMAEALVCDCCVWKVDLAIYTFSALFGKRACICNASLQFSFQTLTIKMKTKILSRLGREHDVRLLLFFRDPIETEKEPSHLNDMQQIVVMWDMKTYQIELIKHPSICGKCVEINNCFVFNFIT